MTTLKTRAAKGSELTHGELDANFVRDVDIHTTTYAALVSDNRTTLECNHGSTPFTITLGDASTMAAAETGDYEVTVANIGAAAVTVARAGSDTIDGVATSIVLQQYSSMTFKVNAATDGYNTGGRGGLGQLTATVAELNIMDGVTASAGDLSATTNFEETLSATTSEVTVPTGKTVNITDNSALKLAGTAITSTAAELNILDGVTSTTAELNELDASARAVSTYASGAVTHISSDAGADTTAIDLDSVLSAGAWESVGPTGSGADNIWTALDSISAGATSVILRIHHFISGSTDTDAYISVLYARSGSSSVSTGLGNFASTVRFLNSSGTVEVNQQVTTIFVPIDSSRVFDLQRSTPAGTSPTVSLDAYLVGWIV